ncbi:AlpA family phage regulatory protein [Dyella sp. C9]|uniref:helix-turn-helix transcriptional regulator n=1 Tax=Dyella sp. C9 TaxID=2202154 RepID=UPI000DF008AE
MVDAGAAKSQLATGDRLIRLPDVASLVGICKTAIYKLVKSGSFPPPVKLGRASAWPEAEVIEYITAQRRSRHSRIR